MRSECGRKNFRKGLYHYEKNPNSNSVKKNEAEKDRQKEVLEVILYLQQ